MAEGTTFRLDTADIALSLGWQVESARHADEFKKDRVTIKVEYASDDDISSIAKAGGSDGYEIVGQQSAAKRDVLRAWLAGRKPFAVETPKPLPRKTSKAPKLRWSRERWLHKPSQEVVDDSDPRVPRTVDASKKVSKIWYRMGSQADVDGGYYRRDIDVQTVKADEPTYTATWHPTNGPIELLIRGPGGHAYWACVRHHQAKYDVA